LTASTLIFSASTLYLWRELELERGETLVARRLPALQARIADVHSLFTPGGQVNSAAPVTAPTEAAPAPPDAAALDAKTDPYAATKKALFASSKAFLVQIADPAMRARLLAQFRDSLRDSFPGIAENLQLNRADFERLLDTLAKNRLIEREAMSRCVVDPACDLGEFQRQSSKGLYQQAADVLGPERAQRFEVYEQTLTARQMVLQLRARLPDQAYLSSELSETLITALAEEAWHAQQEAHQAGLAIDGFGLDTGWVSYVAEGSPEQKIDSAEKYQRRMHERAAQILNADQLKVFDQMQENVLANLHALLDKRRAREVADR